MRDDSSRSDGTIVAVGFNPRFATAHVAARRVATIETAVSPGHIRVAFERRYATQDISRGDIPSVG